MVTPQWGSFEKPNSTNKINDEPSPNAIAEDSLNKPQWGNFLSPTTYQGEIDKNEEGWLEYIGRNLAANTSRGLEQLGGFYGNVESFGRGLLSKVPATGGLIGWGISKLVGPEKWQEYVGDKQFLPTSEDFKKLSHELTNDYTKAKTSGEAAFQEFTEDVVATLRGRPGGNAIRNPTLRRAYNSLVTPAAANVAKQTLKGLGFSEDQANIAKLATWIPLTLAGNVSAPNYASQLMNQGRQGIPNSVQMNIRRMTHRLNQLEKSPYLLNSDPRTALARQQIASIRNDIANGQTNSQSLFTMYDGVNAAKRNRGLFELNKSDQAFAKRSIDQVRNAVRDEIREVGQNYPQALKSWENGVQAWATIHQSNAITNWIQSIAKGPYAKILTGPAAGLLGFGSYKAVHLPGFISTGTSAAIPASYKSGQAIYRIWNNPNLRNYYWNAIQAATEENLPVFINNYEKLNKELEKDSFTSSTSSFNVKNQKDKNKKTNSKS